MLLRLRIFDKHEKQVFVNGRQKIRLLDETDETWQKFDIYIDTELIRIEAFREYLLFDTEKNPTQCTKVFLSDGSYVYAAYTAATFLKKYEKHLKGEKADEEPA